MTKKLERLRIFRRQSPVGVLGPYRRVAIWVQGCQWSCAGCIVPESWSLAGGEEVLVSELATWILTQTDIEGITLSGGEPMLQAEALVTLLHQVQQERDFGVVCYTGYRHEQLQQQGTVAQRELLKGIDLLIDGVYVEALHDDLLWRGSRNQRLLLLSQRYREVVEAKLAAGDASAGLEFGVNAAGEFHFNGVPNQRGFRGKLEGQLQRRGIILEAGGDKF